MAISPRGPKTTSHQDTFTEAKVWTGAVQGSVVSGTSKPKPLYKCQCPKRSKLWPDENSNSRWFPDLLPNIALNIISLYTCTAQEHKEVVSSSGNSTIKITVELISFVEDNYDMVNILPTCTRQDHIWTKTVWRIFTKRNADLIIFASFDLGCASTKPYRTISALHRWSLPFAGWDIAKRLVSTLKILSTKLMSFVFGEDQGICDWKLRNRIGD